MNFAIIGIFWCKYGKLFSLEIKTISSIRFFLEAMSQRCSLKHVFFRNLAKFSEKHLYRNPFLIDVGL